MFVSVKIIDLASQLHIINKAVSTEMSFPIVQIYFYFYHQQKQSEISEDIGNSWKKEQSIQDVLDTRKEEHDFLNNHNDEVRESYTVLMIVSSGQLGVSGQFDEHHQIVY